jgi:hypothetical protein
MNKLTTVDKEKKKNQKEKKINNIHIVCLYLLLISVYKYKAAYSSPPAKCSFEGKLIWVTHVYPNPVSLKLQGAQQVSAPIQTTNHMRKR